MNRTAGLVSVGVLTSVLLSGQAWAEEMRSVSDRSREGASAIVASFLEGECPEHKFLEGTFAISAPALSMPEPLSTGLSEVGVSLSAVFLPAVPASDAPSRLILARPRTRQEMAPTVSSPTSSSKEEPAMHRVKAGSGPDALELSRAAFPMVVGPALADMAAIRPMLGPAVGVRPSYIPPATFQ